MLILYQYVAPGVINFGSPHGYFTEEDDGGDIFPSPDPHYVKKYYFPVRDLERTVEFEIKGEDVIVFLHIQKTGGTTFGRHLVQNVRLEVPCDCRPGQKKCTCYRPNRKETWLFSRFSTGWSCGLHADWTELKNCVPGVLDKKETRMKNERWDKTGKLTGCITSVSVGLDQKRAQPVGLPTPDNCWRSLIIGWYEHVIREHAWTILSHSVCGLTVAADPSQFVWQCFNDRLSYEFVLRGNVFFYHIRRDRFIG